MGKRHKKDRRNTLETKSTNSEKNREILCSKLEELKNKEVGSSVRKNKKSINLLKANATFILFMVHII